MPPHLCAGKGEEDDVTTSKMNGEWFARAAGGFVTLGSTTHSVQGNELGPFAGRPKPTARWRQEDRSSPGGVSVYVYTLFAVSGLPAFVLRQFSFWSSRSHCLEEDWEDLLPPREPPLFGEIFRWTGGGWELPTHPTTVKT